MTEEEARTKWCPQIRWTSHGEGYSDPFENRGSNCNCIASDCMMWRWNRDIMAGGSGRAEPTQGYCGLAGKP